MSPGVLPAESREEGLILVRALVDRFAANEAHYTSPDFDETSTREQFVNGLFDALGWDVLDAAGRGEGRDVIFHPRLRDVQELAGAEEWDEDLTEEELAAREPVAQIPDYAFRFDSSTASSFVLIGRRKRVRCSRRISQVGALARRFAFSAFAPW